MITLPRVCASSLIETLVASYVFVPAATLEGPVDHPVDCEDADPKNPNLDPLTIRFPVTESVPGPERYIETSYEFEVPAPQVTDPLEFIAIFG